MKFEEKNDFSIILYLAEEERELLYNALRFYSAYCENENYIIEQIPIICEFLNVIEFKKSV